MFWERPSGRSRPAGWCAVPAGGRGPTTEPPRASTTDAQSPWRVGVAQRRPNRVPRLRDDGVGDQRGGRGHGRLRRIQQDPSVPGRRAGTESRCRRGAVRFRPGGSSAPGTLLMSTTSCGDAKRQLHQRDQALAAGQHLGVVPARRAAGPIVPRRATRGLPSYRNPRRIHRILQVSFGRGLGLGLGVRGRLAALSLPRRPRAAIPGPVTATGSESSSGSGRGCLVRRPRSRYPAGPRTLR